jgi:glycosyltransferase involved in cell wall biosynthesis
MSTRFVTAFNGSRDYYELPLALHELNMLECHVSDLYLPDVLVAAANRFYPKALQRHRQGLPSAKVKSVAKALLPQIPRLLGLPNQTSPYGIINRALSLAAAARAEHTGSNLFLHSGCAFWAFERYQNCRKWLYQYHPHPLSVQAILAADFAAHPEVRASFESETDSQPIAKVGAELLSEWKFAEHIFCASSFTASTLLQQGCDPSKLHVIPYGSFIKSALDHDVAAKGRRCQFLFIGQGVQRKGLHHLLKAWKLAGLSECDLRVICRRLDPGIAPLLEQSNVRFQPGVSPQELDHVFQDSDVFVMPSLVEGFGLVYLEALAAGLFCIGTSNTGLPDLCPPENAARIVPAGRIDDLAAALVDAFHLWQEGRLKKSEISQFAQRRTWAHHREELKAKIRALTIGDPS